MSEEAKNDFQQVQEREHNHKRKGNPWKRIIQLAYRTAKSSWYRAVTLGK